MAAQGHAVLPSAIFLANVRRISIDPIYGGSFSDVYKGECNGRVVALKVLRVFDSADLQRLQIVSKLSDTRVLM